MDAIFSYDGLRQELELLSRDFPFLRIAVAGRTALGRGLFTLSLGSRQNRSLLVGGFSGSDAPISAFLLRYCRRLCEAYREETPLYGLQLFRAFLRCGVTVLPCLNPDGIEIARRGPAAGGSLRDYVRKTAGDTPWEGNALGVLLQETFMSPQSPLQSSEAETRALCRLCRKDSFRQALALTSGSRGLFCRQLGLSQKETALGRVLAHSSGCFLGDSAASDAGCGFSDWFSETFRRPAFTMQVGKEVVSSPTANTDSIDQQIEEALVMFPLL